MKRSPSLRITRNIENQTLEIHPPLDAKGNPLYQILKAEWKENEEDGNPVLWVHVSKEGRGLSKARKISIPEYISGESNDFILQTWSSDKKIDETFMQSGKVNKE